MWLLLFSAQTSALYRPSSAPHLRLRGGDGEETQQPGQETLAQALAMAQARVRMSLDPARYRSASQGPPGSFPLPEYGEIDRVIDRATQTDGWAPVIPQYNGTLRWARHQWKGTINEHLWRPAAVSMIVPFLFIGATRFVAPSARWFPSPDETHPVRPPRSRFRPFDQQHPCCSCCSCCSCCLRLTCDPRHPYHASRPPGTSRYSRRCSRSRTAGATCSG